MGVIESVKKGFSVAFRSSNLVLVLFTFSFIWNLLNIPFQGDMTSVTASVSLVVLGLVVLE